MRVCDRCGSDAVARKYVEKIEGSELDLCAPCDELLSRFLSEPKKERALEDDIKRGRHKRTA